MMEYDRETITEPMDESLPVEEMIPDGETSQELPPEPLPEEADETAVLDPELPDEETVSVGRMAEEFLQLCDETDGIHIPEDLPDDVWIAAMQGVPLRDAYLRFWYAECSRRQAAAQAQERSAAGSAGSLRDIPDDPRPEEAAFARSFQTAVE